MVGVLATTQTLASPRLARLVATYGSDIRVESQACPGWVEHVERGQLSDSKTRALVEQGVAPLLAKGADTLVLGCTHYPFLKPLIAEFAGPDVKLIDTGEAVARQLVRRLAGAQEPTRDAVPRERFWTTGVAPAASGIVTKLWGTRVSVERLADD